MDYRFSLLALFLPCCLAMSVGVVVARNETASLSHNLVMATVVGLKTTRW
jgi:hypothetical protein